MRNIEIATKLSTLKTVSRIDDDYLVAATRGSLKNFVIFTGKHLCWSILLIKLQACKFVGKRLKHWCFPLHVRKIFKNTYFEKHHRAAASDHSFISAIYFFRMSLSIIKKN